MPIKQKLARLFLKSSLYYACLGKPKFDRLNNGLSHKRIGSKEKGLKIIFNKTFEYGEQNITVKNFRKMFRDAKNSNSLWALQINSFVWLKDLTEVRSNHARICARSLITNWIKENSRWDEKNYEIGTIGKRLFFLFTCYDFYGLSADDKFKTMLFDSMYKQEKFLKRAIKKVKNKSNYDYFQAINGLIFSNIFFINGDSNLFGNFKLLKESLDAQILIDGGHISRNSFLSLKVLRSLIDIDYLLKSSKKEVPIFISNYIKLITKFIKSIMYKDGKLPVFNDSFEYEYDEILDVLDKINFRVKAIDSLPISGYEKIYANKTNVLISTASENKDDRQFGVSSFEMQYDKSRIVVNCGAYMYKEKYRKALQKTVAHSMLNLDGKNNLSCSSKVTRRKNKSSTSVAIENSGYYNNLIFRKILVSDDGRTVAGTDKVQNISANIAEIRFHLHPEVSASFVKNKKYIILKVGKKSGWIFRSSTDNVVIEDSVYLGKTTIPQQTKQIVVRAELAKGENSINWVFEKQN